MSNFNPVTKIKVFGVGGGGCNAVNHMVEADLTGVTFYVANTDQQVLSNSKCDNKILLGQNTTKGLGAGGKPEIGREAALESLEDIKEAVKDADMIFVAAGLGGGTGTGAAPIFAKAAKESGALTIGTVTKPFNWEGKKRTMQAIEGLDELRKCVDSLIIIPNDKVGEILGSIPMTQAFIEADNVLRQSVQTITDLVSYRSVVNLDFADVRETMANQGAALIGVGQASLSETENNDSLEMAILASQRAVDCPLLETSISGARRAIINITGSASTTIDNARAAVNYIKDSAGNDIDAIFGFAYNEALQDSIIVTVIATGFEDAGASLFEMEKPAMKFEPAQRSQRNEASQPVDIDIPPLFNNRAE